MLIIKRPAYKWVALSVTTIGSLMFLALAVVAFVVFVLWERHAPSVCSGKVHVLQAKSTRQEFPTGFLIQQEKRA